MSKLFSCALSISLLLILSFAATAEPDKNSQKLDAILAAQPDNVKARFQFRHPKETLLFFGIKPGMTVIEALPGSGWYTKILLPYLGPRGWLIETDYPVDMWTKFDWASPEFIEGRRKWPGTWPVETQNWKIADAAKVSAYTFKTLPEDLSNKVDAVLFIRALHNLLRFESDGGYFTNALRETYRVLKPGGVVGVVQHSAMANDLDGSTGYLEHDSLIKRFQALGFKFISESNINANPKDKADGIVWRLPPTLATSKNDEDMRKNYMAIGESNRMTLKFIKPAGN